MFEGRSGGSGRNNDASRWAKNKELVSNCPSIRVALGLHPQLIAESHNEIDLFEQLLSSTRFIGEIGLDADSAISKASKRNGSCSSAFWSNARSTGDKILSIHAGRATREVLALLERCFPEHRGKAVLHWFRGSKAEAKRALDWLLFLINGEMLKTDSRREVVATLPFDRILTRNGRTLHDYPRSPGETIRCCRHRHDFRCTPQFRCLLTCNLGLPQICTASKFGKAQLASAWPLGHLGGTTSGQTDPFPVSVLVAITYFSWHVSSYVASEYI